MKSANVRYLYLRYYIREAIFATAHSSEVTDRQPEA